MISKYFKSGPSALQATAVCAVLAMLGLGVHMSPASADGLVEMHCVAEGVPLEALDPVESNDSKDTNTDVEVNVFEEIDAVPAQADVLCFEDEDLAWEAAGAGGAIRVGKWWTGTNYSGTSLVLKVDGDPNGCTDGSKYGFTSLGVLPNGVDMNNNIESAKGFSDCTLQKFWNWKNFQPTPAGHVCSSPCSTLGSFNNKTGSLKIMRP